MKVVKLPKGHAGQTKGRLVMTRTGDWIHAVVSVKSPMQETSEFADHETVEKAEAYGIDFAHRYRAEILYIEDRT